MCARTLGQPRRQKVLRIPCLPKTIIAGDMEFQWPNGLVQFVSQHCGHDSQFLSLAPDVGTQIVMLRRSPPPTPTTGSKRSAEWRSLAFSTAPLIMAAMILLRVGKAVIRLRFEPGALETSWRGTSARVVSCPRMPISIATLRHPLSSICRLRKRTSTPFVSGVPRIGILLVMPANYEERPQRLRRRGHHLCCSPAHSP